MRIILLLIMVFPTSDSIKSVFIGGINIYDLRAGMLFGMLLITCIYIVGLVLNGRGA